MIKRIAKGINFSIGQYLKSRKVFIGSSLEYLNRNRIIDKNYFDYIRISTLELVSFEIKNKKLEGNVAELGVYKGKFARYINQYFPDRTLYLFDTFEGFNKNDIEKDNAHNFSTGDQDFSDTSVAAVVKLMPYPDKCKVVKGFFPESAKGIIEDKFVYVSLDADLYDPIYEGMNFFFPRLIPGGYIFIHDFNNDGYKGCRKAVETFCSENNINYMPLPDSCGSVVILK